MCIREWCTSSGRFFASHCTSRVYQLLYSTGQVWTLRRTGMDFAVYQVCTVTAPLSVWIQHSLMGTPSPKDTKSFSTHGLPVQHMGSQPNTRTHKVPRATRPSLWTHKVPRTTRPSLWTHKVPRATRPSLI